MPETAPTCPYCAATAMLTTGDWIYPHRSDLADRRFWVCWPCDAYVGCHARGVGQGDGTRPLGRLANAALRRAKREAHDAFDALWLGSRQRGTARRAAYQWLAGAMGITVEACHIGEMDEAQCARVVSLVRQRMQEQR